VSARVESFAAARSYQSADCRWTAYVVLILLALATLAGRILTVQAADRQTPFLSANDRSRWATVRALVDHGTYAIDRVITQRGWNTIDKVRHRDRQGEMRYYSSKPPLFPTLMAGEYWVIKKVTGATLAKQPFYVGRLMLLLTNLLPLAVYLAILAFLFEQYAQSSWAAIVLAACATFGTFVTTFGITINNHVPAAVGVAVSLWGLLRIVADRQAEVRWHALTGLGAAWAAANELPALSWLALCSLAAVVVNWRRALMGLLPPVIIVAAGFLATNYVAHDSLRPPYMHRHGADNWYDYPGTYWHDDVRKGIDRGERSRAVYALHVLVGHHGIFSLTPIWILAAAGCVLGLWNERPEMRWLAAITGLLSLVCIAFYLNRPLIDRNYGGMTSGFRWVFWISPLWLIMMVPCLERLSRLAAGRWLTYVCLAVSVFSANFAAANPWSHPWIYRYGEALGWLP
jgi:hypothetical protein